MYYSGIFVSSETGLS